MNTPFYQDPIMRQSSLSASMAPSWISTYGPDKRSPKAAQSSHKILIDNRDFLIRKQQTEALYSQTNQEYKRIEALYKKNNISGSNYERAKADFLVAKSNYETAVNALSDTICPPLTTDISKISISNLSKTWKRADPYLHRTGQAQDRDLYTRGSRLTLIW